MYSIQFNKSANVVKFDLKHMDFYGALFILLNGREQCEHSSKHLLWCYSDKKELRVWNDEKSWQNFLFLEELFPYITFKYLHIESRYGKRICSCNWGLYNAFGRKAEMYFLPVESNCQDLLPALFSFHFSCGISLPAKWKKVEIYLEAFWHSY